MIDNDGNVRIMDFGIARFLEGGESTVLGVMLGTPEFMSPEQVDGEEIDERSDIYSLGVILYQMLTGKVPFEGDNPLTIGIKHKTEIPKNPREINIQITEELSEIILKCLEKKKEDRYQSVIEVSEELDKIEQDLPLTVCKVPERKLNSDGENILPSKEAQPFLAVLPFEDLSPQQDQGYLCDGIAAELISRLIKTEKVHIPAQASSFSFKGKQLDVQEIGDKLGVDFVLAGSLQKSEDRLRITVELVKVSDGFPVWSEQYERKMEDIFHLEDEISLSIVNSLMKKFLGKK
jgi:TolB-like protein